MKRRRDRERVFAHSEGDAAKDIEERERRMQHKAVYGVEAFDDSEEEAPPAQPLPVVREQAEHSDAEAAEEPPAPAPTPAAPVPSAEEPYRLSPAEEERLRAIREERDRANHERELLKRQRAEQAEAERKLIEEKRLRNAKRGPRR